MPERSGRGSRRKIQRPSRHLATLVASLAYYSVGILNLGLASYGAFELEQVLCGYVLAYKQRFVSPLVKITALHRPSMFSSPYSAFYKFKFFQECARRQLHWKPAACAAKRLD